MKQEILFVLMFVFACDVVCAELIVSTGFEINATVVNSSGINEPNEAEFFNINNIVFNYSNADTDSVKYDFYHNNPVSQQPRVFISTNGAIHSSIICTSGYTNTGNNSCTIAYTDAVIARDTLYAYICGGENYCTAPVEFNFIQNQEVELIDSGIYYRIAFENSSSYSIPRPEYEYLSISSVILNSSDSANNNISFDVFHKLNANQSSRFYITSNSVVQNTLLCTSELTDNGKNVCEFAPSDTVLSKDTLYGYICTMENNDCTVSFPFTMIQRQSSNIIESAIHLGVTVVPSNSIAISYLPPTPVTNGRYSLRDNFTFAIENPSGVLQSCKVEIDGTNYTMTKNANNCSYVYDVSGSDTIQTLSFRAHYTKSGIEDSLPMRTFYIYPSLPSSGNYPYGSLFSGAFGLLMVLSVLIYGGWRR